MRDWERERERKAREIQKIPNIVGLSWKSSGSSIDLAWQDMFCHTASAIQKWCMYIYCLAVVLAGSDAAAGADDQPFLFGNANLFNK